MQPSPIQIQRPNIKPEWLPLLFSLFPWQVGPPCHIHLQPPPHPSASKPPPFPTFPCNSQSPDSTRNRCPLIPHSSSPVSPLSLKSPPFQRISSPESIGNSAVHRRIRRVEALPRLPSYTIVPLSPRRTPWHHWLAFIRSESMPAPPSEAPKAKRTPVALPLIDRKQTMIPAASSTSPWPPATRSCNPLR
jgi:hypothetical protein